MLQAPQEAVSFASETALVEARVEPAGLAGMVLGRNSDVGVLPMLNARKKDQGAI